MRLSLLSALMMLAVAASAQPLPTGEWTGELAWSNAEPVQLTASIESCAEGLKIRLSSEDQRYRTTDMVIAQSGPVDFDIQNTARGYALTCSLSRNGDGALSGNCSTGTSRAHVTLNPPALSTIGCSE